MCHQQVCQKVRTWCQKARTWCQKRVLGAQKCVLGAQKRVLGAQSASLGGQSTYTPKISKNVLKNKHLTLLTFEWLSLGRF